VYQNHAAQCKSDQRPDAQHILSDGAALPTLDYQNRVSGLLVSLLIPILVPVLEIS
jgi:hypothetical protein